MECVARIERCLGLDEVTGTLSALEIEDLVSVRDGVSEHHRLEQVARMAARLLCEAVADPLRARELGRAGRRRAEEAFSWDAVAATTVDLYRSVAGRVG